MRIRKNAKISTLFYNHTNVSNDGDECLLQKNLCRLNQSPWDIITFPSADSSSSLHQFDDYKVFYDVNHAGNESSIDYIRDFERMITVDDSVASVKTVKCQNDNLVDMENDHKEKLVFEDKEVNEVREEILLCDVTDEKGWQCGRMVKNGETMCDHHIIEPQNHAVWSTKKTFGPNRGPVEGTRARKPKKRASTSPYEFYYYSGFGPSWGKKRGTGTTLSNAYDEPAKVASTYNMIQETGSIINDVGLSIDDTGIRKEDVGIFEPETSEIRTTKTDGDDNKKCKTGKKRGRKPMKARSLKSLM